VPDLLAARRGRLAHERGGGDDLARRAEAALERVRADERVDEPVVAQPLDRGDLALTDRLRERDAGERGRTVEENGARATVPLSAGDLRSRQPEFVAERLGEGLEDGAVDRVAAAVDDELSQRPPSA
jgi:hypothetical protein